MTSRRPLVIISGSFSELPQGDSVVGATPTIAASPSGLILVGSDLGIDGVALVSGQAAQSSANAAQSTADTALASGNAALLLASTKITEDEVISLVIGLS
jgi:3-oxoacyl-[acyl-carrier-protein] synthase III